MNFAKGWIMVKTINGLKNSISLSSFEGQSNKYQGFLGTWWLKVSPHCDSAAFRQLNSIHKMVHWDKWTLKRDLFCKVYMKYNSEVQLKVYLKVVSTTFLLVYFVCLKERTCETRKNVFYFTSKALFVLEIIKF